MGMREKLPLLSRTIFSPPNASVSGGSLLHRGGSSLHHGGLFPPHQLGIATNVHDPLHFLPLPTVTLPCQTLKPLSRRLPYTLTATLPHHPPNPSRSPLLIPLSSFPPALLTSVFFGTHHHYNPEPPIQINPKLVAATTRSATIPSAPFHRALLLLLWGSRSLSRDLLLPPRSATVPLTVPPRPPPEPPPSKNGVVLEGTCAFRKLFYLRLVSTLPPSFGSILIRPPPKPPWPLHRSIVLLRFSIVYGDSMLALPPLLLTNHARSRAASILFVNNPHRNFGVLSILMWTFWDLIVTDEAYVTSTYCSDLSKYQSAVAYQGSLVYPENKNSQNVPCRSQNYP